MSYYSELTIKKLRDDADIRYCVPGADVSRMTSYVRCPNCGAEGKGKGLCVTHGRGKNLAKCFKCDFTLSDAIAATMYFQCNEDKSRYTEAIKMTADACGIFIMNEHERRESTVKTYRKSIAKSFCESQLEASGLTVDDVMVKVKDTVNGEVVERLEPSMRKGGLDRRGNLFPGDDEMLIYYYRLDGTMEMYPTRGLRGALRPYIRVRWSNPSLHTPEGSNRENKYQTPAGAPTKFYFPQRIRDLYQSETEITTLVIQEGEKKAEKACKHGVPSIAIQGIFNIGNKDTGLPQDLQYIIQRCKVKNVVLMMDSDWDHLSRNLQPDEAVDYRPRMFAAAAIKFKKYVNSLHNIGVNVDIFFGHVNENPAGDKGVDDLLVGTLKGNEQALAADIDFALHSHNGIATYCSLHNISTLSNQQIQDFWLLNDHEAFLEKYRERLQPLKTFKFNRFLYKIDANGNAVLASKVAAGKEFWSVNVNENTGKSTVTLDTYEALKFIEDAGFYRIHTADLEAGAFSFVRIEDGVVYPSSAVEIREFVWAYILMSTKDANVRNHFSARLTSDLSNDKLERLERIEDTFDNFMPYVQNLYFKNGMLSITPQGIRWDDVIMGQVWNDKVIKHKFERVAIIDHVEYSETEGFKVFPTEAGNRCDFFQFLTMVSNFWHEKQGPLSATEQMEFSQHLMNKITAMGYLLSDYKYQTELKAVIAMDGELSDVGQSNGRTGKSLIGKALSYMMEQTSIDGRNTKNDDDFIYTLVTLRTRNVFMDDVNVNFNFERFYFAITGDLNVNVKGGGRFTINSEHSPKFYITTNHAINGSQSRSSQERIIYMSFSNYFNDTRHPIDVFGHQFFADWDTEQWNLFYNFMAECVYLYFASMNNGWSRPGQGAVLPPMHDIMLRTLRQQMSESIYQWAEVYFDQTGHFINNKVPRGDMFRDFKEHFPDARSGISQANFKTKLCFYCQFKGWHFNPQKLNKEGKSYRHWAAEHPGESFIGLADKSGGVEYFSIYDTEHANNEPF